MKQRYIPWHLVLGGLVAAQAGCVDAADPLRILRNQSPDPGCIVSDSTSGIFLPRGQIDVAAASGYLFTPVVTNEAESTTTVDRLVFLEGANVDLLFTDPDFYSEGELSTFKDEGLTYFIQPFSGSIEAGGSAGFAFEVIPKALLDNIAGKLGEGESTQIIAAVEMVGEINGNEVSSNVFKYPIQVCNGCLTNVLGSCDALPEGEIRTGGTCQALQDGVVDCCTEADGSLTCPAVKNEGGGA